LLNIEKSLSNYFELVFSQRFGIDAAPPNPLKPKITIKLLLNKYILL